jgi:hypothetical protein
MTRRWFFGLLPGCAAVAAGAEVAARKAPAPVERTRGQVPLIWPYPYRPASEQEAEAIVTEALFRIGWLRPGENPLEDEMAHGLNALSRLLGSHRGHLIVDWRGAVLNLACYLWRPYRDTPVPADLVYDAESSRARQQFYYVPDSAA